MVGVLQGLGDLHPDAGDAEEEGAAGVGAGQRVSRGAREADRWRGGVVGLDREMIDRDGGSHRGPVRDRRADLRIGEREPAGEDRVGHRRRGDEIPRGNRPVPPGWPVASRPVATMCSQTLPARRPGPLPGTELHDVVVMAVVPPHAEDRDDIGVVQPRRGPRLPLETLHLLRVSESRIRQNLQRDASAQRFLLGLVDHAHAAAANLAEDAVVAQPRQPRRGVNRHQAAGGVVGAVGAEVLHADQYGEEVADVACELGEAPAIFLERGPLAAALAAEEVVGQRLDGVAVVAGAGGGAHGLGPRASAGKSFFPELGSGRNGSKGKTWSMIRGFISGGPPSSRLIIAVAPGFR